MIRRIPKSLPMTTHSDHPEQNLPKLSDADARLIDRLLGGDASETSTSEVGPAYEARVQRVLDLLGRWEASDPGQDLAERTLTQIITAQPTSLSPEDGVALDALLALRSQGLSTGPMPAGTGVRAQRVQEVLSVLDHSADEPVPEGLVSRTMRVIEDDRAEQRRLSFASASASGRWRPAGGGIRQIATTAALLLMVISVLLPVLNNGKRDAMITQCEKNLAGLGLNLQQFAEDNSPQQTDILKEHFASRKVDGSRVPPSEVNVFVLLGKQNVSPDQVECPSALDPETAYYNGQNPAGGVPIRVLLNANDHPVFADTNPLYRFTSRGLVRDTAIPGMTQSRNHDGVGQNVLISDGSVKWKVRPTVLRPSRDQEDNIWLFQRPSAGDNEPDVFLTP